MAIPQISLNFFGLIPERFAQVITVIKGEPLVYLHLLGIWFIFELYYIVSSSDSDVKEQDLIENSISSIYVALVISPFFGEGGFSLAAFTNPSPRTWLSVILLCYASFLIIMAFTKALPQFMLHILGGASIDMVGTMLALIYVDGSIPFDLATVAIVLLPVLCMYIFQFLRRLSRGY